MTNINKRFIQSTPAKPSFDIHHLFQTNKKDDLYVTFTKNIKNQKVNLLKYNIKKILIKLRLKTRLLILNLTNFFETYTSLFELYKWKRKLFFTL